MFPYLASARVPVWFQAVTAAVAADIATGRA
jgi:hypothetical protein